MIARTRIAVAAGLLAALALACSSNAPAAKRLSRRAAEKTLRLGLIYTTNGQGAELASAVLGAVKLASDDAKARLNIKTEVAELDYAATPERLAAAIGGLASRVDAIIVGTDDTRVVPVLASVTSVPVMYAFVTTTSAVSSTGNAFRLTASTRLESQRVATFLSGHRKVSRVSIISDSTPFGAEGRSELASALSSFGITVVGDFVFTPGGDIHTPVSAAAQRGAQAVVLWVESASEAARIVVDAHKSGFAYQLVLSGNLATATFAKNAGAQVTPVAFRDGMLSVGTWAGPWFQEERIIRFYREFKTTNSALAPVQSAAVYDAVLALATAARAHGTSSQALTQGLEGLADFEGAGAPITFGAGKREGLDLDDVAMYGFTKTQNAPGGEYQPEVDTGGGFFSLVFESLDLPKKYAYLKNNA